MEINNVKIDYPTITITYNEDHLNEQDNLITNTIKFKSNNGPHHDLMEAANNLVAHAIFSCEFAGSHLSMQKLLDNGEVYDPSAYNFYFEAVKVKRKDDHPTQVFIDAHRMIKGNLAHVSAPGITLGDEDYQYCDRFKSDWDTFEMEIIKYLDGKTAANPQLDMFEQAKNDLEKTMGSLKEKGYSLEVTHNGETKKVG